MSHKIVCKNTDGTNEICHVEHEQLESICCGNCKSFTENVYAEGKGLCRNVIVNNDWSIAGEANGIENVDPDSFKKMYPEVKFGNFPHILDVHHCCFDHSELWGLSYKEKVNKLYVIQEG